MTFHGFRRLLSLCSTLKTAHREPKSATPIQEQLAEQLILQLSGPIGIFALSYFSRLPSEEQFVQVPLNQGVFLQLGRALLHSCQVQFGCERCQNTSYFISPDGVNRNNLAVRGEVKARLPDYIRYLVDLFLPGLRRGLVTVMASADESGLQYGYEQTLVSMCRDILFFTESAHPLKKNKSKINSKKAVPNS